MRARTWGRHWQYRPPQALPGEPSTTFAAGGLGGTTAAACLAVRFGAAALLRTGLVIEVVTHATLAVTTSPLVAAVILVIFGVHTMGGVSP